MGHTGADKTRADATSSGMWAIQGQTWSAQLAWLRSPSACIKTCYSDAVRFPSSGWIPAMLQFVYLVCVLSMLCACKSDMSVCRLCTDASGCYLDLKGCLLMVQVRDAHQHRQGAESMSHGAWCMLYASGEACKVSGSGRPCRFPCASAGTLLSPQAEALAAQNLRLKVVQELSKNRDMMEPFIAGPLDVGPVR